MQFEGSVLLEILNRQIEPVEVYDSGGVLQPRKLAPKTAARMSGLYFGVGNRRRVRYLRPVNGAGSVKDLNNGSHTTMRLRGPGRSLLGGKWLREHRPVSPPTKAPGGH
jgi:hypothetical protein